MQKLRNYFESIGFANKELDQVLNAFTLKQYKKNDFFIEEGKTSKHIGFIKSGLFQYFVIVDGNERTTYVSIENTFISSVLSFVSETPSLESVRALTEGEIYLISKIALKKLVNELPKFKDFYIALLENAVCGIASTRHDLIVLNAEQRYEKMLREEPHLLQHIPLQHLASILGVTPRHLSRIRSTIR
ncbi:Crp/Fnr family transcriptional regulator [Haliscomenobacter sp.]|uniref:Crp/Fnr family transcriptional regulator n=1 Tax=Haliscomenobacter sp. TaxID=2717303 RepID=UPI003593427F